MNIASTPLGQLEEETHRRVRDKAQTLCKSRGHLLHGFCAFCLIEILVEELLAAQSKLPTVPAAGLQQQEKSPV